MTVNYSLDASSSTFLGTQRLLFRWKGSLWKSTCAELFLWLAAYYALSISYRFFMDPYQKRIFEDLAVFFNTYSEFIPLTFMLGFYVSTVYNRWREIFDHIGWIDTPALMIASFVRGADERSRMIRRSCVRYLVLVQAMVFRDVSTPVKKRFPTMQHVVTAGLLTESEKTIMDSVTTQYSKFWVPMQWTFSLLKMARDEQRIESDHIYVELIDTIKSYRSTVLSLTLYDWVNVPLVYTQVVTLAVRSYFLLALLGRQFLVTDRDIPKARTMDIYVPVMTILQFLCYFGWLKVAEALLNPLGEDDDDFEVNYILDRNLQVGLLIVDDAYDLKPQLEKDFFWGDTTAEPFYTAESAQRPIRPNVGSCVEFPAKNDGVMIRQRRPTITLANGELTMDGGIEAVPVLGSDHDDSSCRRSSAFSDSNFFKRLQGLTSRKGSISSLASTNAGETRSSSPIGQQKLTHSSPGSGRCEIPIGPLPAKATPSPLRLSFRGRVAPSNGLPAISEEHNNDKLKAKDSTPLDANVSTQGNDADAFIKGGTRHSGSEKDEDGKTHWRM
ncbi:Bestrophin-1 [Toxocara canis]|uniref:Bestrophin homolog n=1 Tax=Toxocara canis TaxID=6265 RepID=A0A0B2VI37_TOXCA|nr:Bestrophin-1 [Toxocara canis]